jgi:hypothetical protein
MTINNLSELKAFVVEKGFQYPHLREKIYAAYKWCVSEVVDYDQPLMDEIELCLSSIEEFIKNDE